MASLPVMLILLPPSEGKSAAESGPKVSIARLAFPALNPTRCVVLDALVDLCSGDVDEAATVLGLGVTQRGEVGANAALTREPCAPAIDVYTGVLYEHLDAATLNARARQRLAEHVAIASALWGLVRPDDLIPAYRLSGGTTLPALGTLASVWRPALEELLGEMPGLLVDMRSGAYTGLGPVPLERPGQSVTLRVLNELNGKRTVVSHNNKATKGEVVRSLMTSRRTPSTIDGLADALANEGYRVELTLPSPKAPLPSLDLILS